LDIKFLVELSKIKNNYVECLSVDDNAAKNFNILASSLNPT